MEMIYHQNYCICSKGHEFSYDAGAIRRIYLEFPLGVIGAEIQIYFANGEMYWWKSKWISSYILQLGIAVSYDGKYVFAQTWENGLLCLDSHTGEVIWRTKSKRGITSIFVNDQTILCHQRERALQLLDIHTGEVLAEKRPATAWGFTALDHQHIICQVTAKRWEIIDAQTMQTLEVFSHKDFTGGYVDFCVNKIERTENGKLRVSGFKNVWDHSVKPAVMLPNLEFEHYVHSDILSQD
jgi:hypothetical protein